MGSGNHAGRGTEALKGFYWGRKGVAYRTLEGGSVEGAGKETRSTCADRE